MYFTKIRLVGLHAIDLPLVGVSGSDKFRLKSADGLDPVAVDVFISSTARQGGVYQGRQPQSRQLVFQIELHPDYYSGETVEQLRTKLYGMLTPGVDDIVVVQLMSDDVTVIAQTSGHVKNFQAALFSAEPLVQITIDCVDSYFKAPNQIDLTGLSKEIASLTNVGTAPSGLHMELTFTSNLPYWILTNVTWSKHMYFDYAFLSGDTLKFDTTPGKRSISLVRSGTTYNILQALSADSDWFMIHGGLNIWFISSPAFNWGPVWYTPQYWGV